MKAALLDGAFLQLPRCIKVVYDWLNNRFYLPRWKRHRKLSVSVHMQENPVAYMQYRLRCILQIPFQGNQQRYSVTINLSICLMIFCANRLV